MKQVPLQAPIAFLVALRSVSEEMQVLLLRRTQTLAGTRCQVAGKIEAGGMAWRAVVRELFQETGWVLIDF